MHKILLLLLTISVLLSCIFVVSADSDTVILAINGDLNAALDAVSDGGTIRIDGRYNIPKDFSWENHGKSISIVGGYLNFKGHSDFVLGDNVRFKNITLQFDDGSTLYANGFALTLESDVKIDGDVTLYGGGKLTTVAETNMTLLGGTFLNVYGGGNSGKVNGDVNLTIGGNFNKDMGSISHAHENQVFGAGNNCTINGDVNLTFGGNAKANYIYGGGGGKSSKINGTVYLNFTGGKAMSIYGGSHESMHKSDVYISFTGGNVQQIFGGCEKASMVGDILMYINGGKVTRRIYGGCYNNYTYDGWQSVPNYVYGNILLILGEDLTLSLSYGADDAVYAHSRQATIPKTEVSHLAFTSQEAQNKHKKNLGAQDWTMKDIMGNTKIADEQHIITVEITDNAIIQKCDRHDSAAASLSVSDGIYTGQAQENAVLTVDENWLGPKPIVEYENNIAIGKATATIIYGDQVVDVTYTIWPPVWVYITAGGGLLVIIGSIVTILLIVRNKKKKAAV